MSADRGGPLVGQSVLVVGGTGSMGSAICTRARLAGARVTIAGRRQESVDWKVAELGAADGVVLDATDDAAVGDVLGRGRFDHVVVAVAATANASSIGATQADDARAAFQRFWSTYSVLHHAHGSVGRSVLAVSGSSARRPAQGMGVWGTLHAAINGLVVNAAVDLAPLRVNAISPGGIGFEHNDQLLDRPGRPDDIGAMAAAILANGAMTGAVVDVDSGERFHRAD